VRGAGQPDVSDSDAGGVRSDFYFMILRPQQKRTKEHKNLMNSIAKGDEVLTNGLVGRVTKVAESGYIAIALNDTTEVVIKRDFVAAVLPKGTMKAL
jgi:preprotein translocase subunit YajC